MQPVKTEPSAPDRPVTPDRTPLHPASALTLLVFDYLFFGLEAPLFTLPLSCAAAAVLTLATVTLIQRRAAGDRWLKAAGKGLFCAVIAALPTPIAGTAVGTLVLAMAGLRNHRKSDRNAPRI